MFLSSKFGLMQLAFLRDFIFMLVIWLYEMM